MSSRHYYRIHADGKCESVEEAVRLVSIQPEMLSSLAKGIIRKLPNVFNAGVLGPDAAGNVGLALGDNNASMFTIPVPILPMTAIFRMEGEVLTPTFASPDSDTITLKWTPPADMAIYLMVFMNTDPSVKSHYCSDAFLFAQDATAKRYRLPVSNVYEDGRLCTGSYDSYGNSAIESLSKCWKQFHISRWQRDLVDRGGKDQAKHALNMFRYKPKKDSGFEQLPIVGSWQSNAVKFGNEFVNQHFCI